VKQSLPYRLAHRLRRTTTWRQLRRLKRRRGIVDIRATGTKNPTSQGTEVWLLQANWEAGGQPVPWDFISHDKTWFERDNDSSAFGRCLLSESGTLTIRLGTDPELRFLRHPNSGMLELRRDGNRELVDLYSPLGDIVTVHPARTPMLDGQPSDPIPSAAGAAAPDGTLAAHRRLHWTSSHQQEFIEAVRREQPRAVAVHCPRWLGVTSSIRNLFSHTYPVPERIEDDPYLVDSVAIERHAEVILASGVHHIVVAGGDEVHLELVRTLRRRDPGCRCDLLWHGSHLQLEDDYTWKIFTAWTDAARIGLVHTIGTVKKGMEEVLRARGIRSSFVMNYLWSPWEPPLPIEGCQREVGLWLSSCDWRKSPHAALSAMALLPDVRLHTAGLNRRSRELAEFLGLTLGTCEPAPLEPYRLFEEIRRTHLTLYTTLSECCPMLALESLALGVPCLIGPTSHLFEDAPELFNWLVVPFPERADVIAHYAERAIAERAEIVAAYARYVPAYNEAARRSLERFLD
jgi:hypothetical protein